MAQTKGSDDHPMSTFDEELEGIGADEVPARSEAVDVLDELADAIKRNVFSGMGNVQVGLAPGFTVNMGQQYKIVVRILEDRDNQFPSYTDILVRTYVPSAGYPVVVDAFGEEKAKCSDRVELEAALKKLLKHPDLRLRLESLKTLARHRSRRTFHEELRQVLKAENEIDECHQWLNEYGVGGKDKNLLCRISLMADMAHEKLESEKSLWQLNAENAAADRDRLVQER